MSDTHPVDRLLAGQRILPVISLSAAEQAVPLAETLLACGFRAIEITLRHPSALAGIRAIAAALPEVVVGAGTVLNADELDRAVGAGARFLISPGLTEPLLRAGRQSPVPLIPGVATASEIQLGLDQGYTRFKFFPAAAAGGVAMLRAWQGPFGAVHFIPTGGIRRDSAADYLALPQVLAVGGSWMVPPDRIEAGDWAGIRALVKP